MLARTPHGQGRGAVAGRLGQEQRPPARLAGGGLAVGVPLGVAEALASEGANLVMLARGREQL